MADSKLEDLDAVVAIGDTDVFYIVAGSVDKKITGASMKSELGTADHGSLTGLGDNDHPQYPLASNVLELDNTDAFTPDADYEPATKKYVDDNSSSSPWNRTGTDLTTATAGDTVSLADSQQLRLGTGNDFTLEYAATYVLFKLGSDRFLHNIGTNNVFLGTNSGNLALSGAVNNIGMGVYSLSSLTSGDGNTALGASALRDVTDSSGNTAVGYNCLANVTTGSRNVAIGDSAGYNNVSGAGNVFLGDDAGYNETGSDKLYIANTNTATPLILGDFSAGTVKIAGTMEAAFKSSDGSAGITATITTARLTPTTGSEGSMTFKDGILVAQTQAT